MTIYVWLGIVKNQKDSITGTQTNINGHILCNPINENSHMALICFKNGSLTRERISKDCAESEWSIFSELLDSTPRGNFGNIGFYFDCEEIYPLVSGDFRFNNFNTRVNRFSKEVEVRACIEGQFLRLRAHAEELGYSLESGSRILATGGASANKSILQVLADVFNTPVYVQEKPNSAAIGAAFMAKYSLNKDTVSFEEMTAKAAGFALVTSPASDANAIYTPMIARYKELEKVIQGQ
jgi:xylulokinase